MTRKRISAKEHAVKALGSGCPFRAELALYIINECYGSLMPAALELGITEPNLLSILKGDTPGKSIARMFGYEQRFVKVNDRKF